MGEKVGRLTVVALLSAVLMALWLWVVGSGSSKAEEHGDGKESDLHYDEGSGKLCLWWYVMMICMIDEEGLVLVLATNVLIYS